jgi:hypothetical protein
MYYIFVYNFFLFNVRLSSLSVVLCYLIWRGAFIECLPSFLSLFLYWSSKFINGSFEINSCYLLCYLSWTEQSKPKLHFSYYSVVFIFFREITNFVWLQCSILSLTCHSLLSSFSNCFLLVLHLIINYCKHKRVQVRYICSEFGGWLSSAFWKRIMVLNIKYQYMYFQY